MIQFIALHFSEHYSKSISLKMGSPNIVLKLIKQTPERISKYLIYIILSLNYSLVNH